MDSILINFWYFGIAAPSVLMLIDRVKLNKKERVTDATTYVWALLSLIAVLPIFGFLSAIVAGSFPLVAILFYVASGLGAMTIFSYLMRGGSQKVDEIKHDFTMRPELERNKKTDIRTVSSMLPKAGEKFDPRDYFDKEKGLFIGLDENKKPVYTNYEDWLISHALLTGRTRSGKGVAAQIMLSQAIDRGEYVVALDPKVDNWMPHIFREQCERSGVPYRYLDLRQSAGPQINIFEGCDFETIENMLVGGFSLTEKGTDADFYKLADRKAARRCARFLADNPGSTARDALAKFGGFWSEECAAFHAYMEELAEIPALNLSSGGYNVADGEKTGGCLYVVGDMINTRIIRMQRMILLRMLFLAKNRDQMQSGHRTITVLADEFKVHISRPFIMSLGASAGWGLHVILAFQSLQDLADVPADLDKDAVRGSVNENCAIALSYAIKDPETREWVAASTGKILVDDETRTVDKNIMLAETVDSERSIRQAERFFIDENMLKAMPKGCGVLAKAGELEKFIYTSPVPAVRVREAITPTYPASPGAQKPAARSTPPAEKTEVDLFADSQQISPPADLTKSVAESAIDIPDIDD